MQNPHGEVLAVHSNGSGANVLVAIDAVTVCARCAAGKGCGAGLLGSSPGNRQVEAIASAHLDVRPGDEVRIALQPRNVLQAAWIVYGYPLLGAFAAALLAYAGGFDDLAAALAALSGIMLGGLVARWRLRGARCLQDFTPVIVEILGAATD